MSRSEKIRLGIGLGFMFACWLIYGLWSGGL